MNALNVMKQKGQIAIMTAFTVIVLIAAVGIVIDSGQGYIIKAKLNAAVDAAGIAGARAVAQGDTQSIQTANAMAAAQRFFHANYPDGYLGSTPNQNDPKHDPRVTVTFGSPGTEDQGKVFIDVSANAVVPVTFMRVFDYNMISVSALAQVVRKDLDMAFVVDTTDSMASVASQVKVDAKSFLDFFSPTTDRVGLINFAYGVDPDPVCQDPEAPVCVNRPDNDGVQSDRTFEIRKINRGFDRPTMKRHIDNLNYNLGGFTNYSEGLWQARDQLNKITQVNRSSLRVIVFFSDGSPNTFASSFSFQNPTSCSNQPGAIVTGAGASGTPDGLYRYDQQNQIVPGCYPLRWNPPSNKSLTSTALPNWYNAHNVNDQEFPVVTNMPPPWWHISYPPRVVTNATSSTITTWTNVNRAARNLGEFMAAKSRSEGIYVFTLGLGSHLSDPTGPDNEHGDIVLKCMANVPNDPVTGTGGCPRYDANSLQGLYCYAPTTDDLKPCFSRLASEIMRLTR